jgi:hypothetical protein
MGKDLTLDEKAEEIHNKLKEIALKADVSMNDIYTLVFRQYKMDNALRTESNKNQELAIQEKRMILEGKKFLIDDFYTTRALIKVQKKRKHEAWMNKNIYGIFKKQG